MRRILVALPLLAVTFPPSASATPADAAPMGVVFEKVSKPADYDRVRARAVDEIGRGHIEDGPSYTNFEKAMRYVWKWGGGAKGVESLRAAIERNLKSNFGGSSYLKFELDGTYVDIELARPMDGGGMYRVSGGLTLQ